MRFVTYKIKIPNFAVKPAFSEDSGQIYTFFGHFYLKTPTMRHIYVLIFIGLLLACESDTANRNPFLPDVSFRFDIDLNLPLYTNLNNIGNPVYIGNAGIGIRGVFVMRFGPSDNQFVAWEASCPNQVPTNCSTMTLSGQNVICPCDEFEYSLFSGQLLNRPDDGNQYFDLLFYRAVQAGNSVIVSN